MFLRRKQLEKRFWGRRGEAAGGPTGLVFPIPAAVLGLETFGSRFCIQTFLEELLLVPGHGAQDTDLDPGVRSAEGRSVRWEPSPRPVWLLSRVAPSSGLRGRDGCLLARPRVRLTCATPRPAGAHVCGETVAGHTSQMAYTNGPLGFLRPSWAPPGAPTRLWTAPPAALRGSISVQKP